MGKNFLIVNRLYLILLVIPLLLLGCSPVAVSYYSGEMLTTSPDGSIPYGPPKKSLVKRTIDTKNHTITELVYHGNKVFEARMVRDDGPLDYKASDPDGSYSGTISFVGQNVKKSDWTYDLKMSDGSGSITGEGKIDAKSIETTKYFTDPSGEKQVRITDQLTRISRGDFEALEKVAKSQMEEK